MVGLRYGNAAMPQGARLPMWPVSCRVSPATEYAGIYDTEAKAVERAAKWLVAYPAAVITVYRPTAASEAL